MARQIGDWERVVALGEVAFQIDDQPNRSDERIPFVEGYAHEGYWERALELTRETMAHNTESQRALCSAWERIEAGTSNGLARQAAIAEAKAFVCLGP